MNTIFGIKNCDTMKRAFKWLDENGINYKFHDYRKDGIDEKMVQQFVDQLGIDLVLNKRGTTWRKISEEIKLKLDEESLIKLMCENEAMIKRPIFDLWGYFSVGFSRQAQEKLGDKFLR